MADVVAEKKLSRNYKAIYAGSNKSLIYAVSNNLKCGCYSSELQTWFSGFSKPEH